MAPGFGGALLGVLPNVGPRLIDVVMPRLINELAELPEPVVLVLDDYHLVQDELVHASLAYLLRHAPPTLQLALATRVDPPLPLARLRAADELVEVRAHELHFSSAETEALLNGSLALGLGGADVELLQARTEGWPAGLQLAGLSLRGREDRAQFVRSFAGDRPPGRRLPARGDRGRAAAAARVPAAHVGAGAHVRPAVRRAVVGDDDAARLLEEAYRSNLFIVGLDDRGHWFRYHHLFRELLRSELARAEPELAAELHARAYAWHLAAREPRRGDRPRHRRRPRSTTPAS